MRTCVPCHGASLRGDGPVVAKYIPPPDLLAAMTRGRSDGYIYAYIRHGGAVMPNYGALVTAHEAYDLINYIRHEQKTHPR
jgi:mono/diheme cytochrome c family protein